MLAKILRMPPTMGVPINRQLSVALNGAGGNADIRWNHVHSSLNRFTVGFPLRKLAGPTFKAVFISNKGHVFEVVFSKQDDHYLCWYVKVISYWETIIGVSLMAVKFLVGGNYPVVPTSRFFDASSAETDIDYIVPVVMGESGLWSFAQACIANARSPKSWFETSQFKILLTDEPQILHALVSGWLPFDPFYSPSGFYPHIDIQQENWFGFEEAFHAATVKGMACEINHREFDLLTYQCVRLRQSKFSITALMSAAADKISSGTWVTRDYVDTYWMMFPDHPLYDAFQNTLDSVFYTAMNIYCRLYDIDIDQYGAKNISHGRDLSSITISKTMSDEVSFTFHDHIHDRHVCFYSFFPLIAMSTLAAGSDIP